ncbi:MAG: hypothetical protein P4L99_21215 [Chthoniobacter sp.]|nr:hypothetical protein [Chthoniobacter sp.]
MYREKIKKDLPNDVIEWVQGLPVNRPASTSAQVSFVAIRIKAAAFDRSDFSRPRVDCSRIA